MKLTPQQLRQIIKEEIDSESYDKEISREERTIGLQRARALVEKAAALLNQATKWVDEERSGEIQRVADMAYDCMVSLEE